MLLFSLNSAVTSFHPGKLCICKMKKKMSVWKVTLRMCCWVVTLPPGLGAERRERGCRAGHQAAICPQDTHKYPCKLQFKRNQYKWQVANATIWGSNEGVPVCVSVCARGVAYTDNSKPAGWRAKGRNTHIHTHTTMSVDVGWMQSATTESVWSQLLPVVHTPCYTRPFYFTEGSVVPSGAYRRFVLKHNVAWFENHSPCRKWHNITEIHSSL